jgi:DNA-binding XRE family transcriptional regulator
LGELGQGWASVHALVQPVLAFDGTTLARNTTSVQPKTCYSDTSNVAPAQCLDARVLHSDNGRVNRDPKVMFGQTLRKIREQRGISQETLADLMEMHRNTVALLERGQRNPSLETIQKLAKALHVAPGKFFEKF